MGKNIIVSNRLPIRITKVNNSFEFTTTSGGLATGMKTFHNQNNSLWIGWPGIGIDEIDNESWGSLEISLNKGGYYPVNLNNSEIDDFYYGLPNKCLWPLFHYFIDINMFLTLYNIYSQGFKNIAIFLTPNATSPTFLQHL